MSDLDSLPPLREVIEAHGLRADKALGQNFLLDLNVTDKIARAAGPLGGATVFEIGPGPGGLTRSLLKEGAESLIAIEFDPRAVVALQSLERAAQGRLRVMQQDALRADLTALAPNGERIIAANLPYNIATQLLIGWLREIRNNPPFVRSMTLMFQKEVADRIRAAPDTKAYGRLAVIAQWLCHVQKQFDLPPSVFVPAPKIVSTVMRFEPKVLGRDAPPFDAVGRITAAAFGQRRKMLRSSLRAFPGLLEKCGIDGTLRAEQLDVAALIRLARAAEES